MGFYSAASSPSWPLAWGKPYTGNSTCREIVRAALVDAGEAAKRRTGPMVETTTERDTFEVPAWLPTDTEESVVGTQWHQEAIDTLATMLVEVGRRHGAG